MTRFSALPFGPLSCSSRATSLSVATYTVAPSAPPPSCCVLSGTLGFPSRTLCLPLQYLQSSAMHGQSARSTPILLINCCSSRQILVDDIPSLALPICTLSLTLHFSWGSVELHMQVGTASSPRSLRAVVDSFEQLVGPSGPRGLLTVSVPADSLAPFQGWSLDLPRHATLNSDTFSHSLSLAFF